MNIPRNIEPIQLLMRHFGIQQVLIDDECHATSLWFVSTKTISESVAVTQHERPSYIRICLIGPNLPKRSYISSDVILKGKFLCRELISGMVRREKKTYLTKRILFTSGGMRGLDKSESTIFSVVSNDARLTDGLDIATQVISQRRKGQSLRNVRISCGRLARQDYTRGLSKRISHLSKLRKCSCEALHLNQGRFSTSGWRCAAVED